MNVVKLEVMFSTAGLWTGYERLFQKVGGCRLISKIE